MTTRVSPQRLAQLTSFTGNVIPDDSTVQEALQSLETAVEAGGSGGSGVAKAHVNVFTGDGEETQFTLDFNPGSIDNLTVSVGGVDQIPGVHYTLAESIITFDEAPPAEPIIARAFEGYDITPFVAALNAKADKTPVSVSADGLMSATDKVKLNGIAEGATVNASDAALRDRSTHSGTQAISTVSGLQDALDTKASASDLNGLLTASETKLYGLLSDSSRIAVARVTGRLLNNAVGNDSSALDLTIRDGGTDRVASVITRGGMTVTLPQFALNGTSGSQLSWQRDGTNKFTIANAANDWLVGNTYANGSTQQLFVIDPKGGENVGRPEIRYSVASFATVETLGHDKALSQRVIGFSGIANNNNTTFLQTVYGIYGEAVRYDGAGPSQASEFNGLNGGTTVDADPFTTLGAITTSTWLSAGRTDKPGFNNPLTAVGVAINNGAYFRRGFVFRNGSLDPAGPREFLTSYAGTHIAWYNAENSVKASLSDNNIMLAEAVAANVPNAAVNAQRLFLDSSDKKLKRKDSTGAISVVEGGSGGNTIVTAVSPTTITPNVDTGNVFEATALANNLTIAAPTGTFVNGDEIYFIIKDNGTARSVTWNAAYRTTMATVAMPATTTASRAMYVKAVYNSTSTLWDIVDINKYPVITDVVNLQTTLDQKAFIGGAFAATGATLSPNANTASMHGFSALAVAATINAPNGSLLDGMSLRIRIKDNGTARALTWNAIYRGIGVTLPTTTVAGKLMYIQGYYNLADAKWDIISIVNEA